MKIASLPEDMKTHCSIQNWQRKIRGITWTCYDGVVVTVWFLGWMVSKDWKKNSSKPDVLKTQITSSFLKVNLNSGEYIVCIPPQKTTSTKKAI
jgi:hypothetical protein